MEVLGPGKDLDSVAVEDLEDARTSNICKLFTYVNNWRVSQVLSTVHFNSILYSFDLFGLFAVVLLYS